MRRLREMRRELRGVPIEDLTDYERGVMALAGLGYGLAAFVLNAALGVVVAGAVRRGWRQRQLGPARAVAAGVGPAWGWAAGLIAAQAAAGTGAVWLVNRQLAAHPELSGPPSGGRARPRPDDRARPASEAEAGADRVRDEGVGNARTSRAGRASRCSARGPARRPSGQASVTGSVSNPRSRSVSRRAGSPAAEIFGNRRSSRGKATAPSSLASAAPMQKCTPPPKLSGPPSGRAGSNRSGSVNRRGSRFPAPSIVSTSVSGDTGTPPTVVS